MFKVAEFSKRISFTLSPEELNQARKTLEDFNCNAEIKATYSTKVQIALYSDGSFEIISHS